jgi:hypothetical protein
VAVAIGVGINTNDDQATIYGNTHVDAKGTISVTTANTYPYLTTPSAFFTGIPQNIITQGMSAITNLLDGTLGVASNLLNTWVMAGAKTSDGPATAYALSIAVNTYFNTSNAVIKSGAQINQDPTYQTAKQSLTVGATTSMQILNVAGQGKWSLNPFGIFFKGTNEGKSLATQASEGDIISLGGRSAARSVGGSVLVGVVTNSTQALIEAGAMVHLGASGKLSMSADEEMNQVEIAQAGGTVGSGGANTISFAGSGLYYGQTSTTYAGIEANDTQGADVTGGAKATITAPSGGMDVGVTGSIITGDGSSTGVGFSVTVDNIQRSTVAFIGADPSGNAHTVPKAASTLDFGDVSISATTGVATLSDGSTAPGLIIGIAVAGTSTTGQFGQSPDNPTKNLTLPANFDQVDGTTGAGLAGGVAINVINDTTLAYMNASGTATTGKLALAGTNNQTMVNISGGVALAFSGKVQNSGGTSIAGAFSLNQTTSDTEAFLKAITLTSTAAAAQGSDQVSLSALMEGIISSGSASLSAGNTDQGKNYALSVSVNRVVDTTDAVMDDVTVTQAGNVGVDAMNSCTAARF